MLSKGEHSSDRAHPRILRVLQVSMPSRLISSQYGTSSSSSDFICARLTHCAIPLSSSIPLCPATLTDASCLCYTLRNSVQALPHLGSNAWLESLSHWRAASQCGSAVCIVERVTDRRSAVSVPLPAADRCLRRVQCALRAPLPAKGRSRFCALQHSRLSTSR